MNTMLIKLAELTSAQYIALVRFLESEKNKLSLPEFAKERFRFQQGSSITIPFAELVGVSTKLDQGKILTNVALKAVINARADNSPRRTNPNADYGADPDTSCISVSGQDKLNEMFDAMQLYLSDAIQLCSAQR